MLTFPTTLVICSCATSDDEMFGLASPVLTKPGRTLLGGIPPQFGWGPKGYIPGRDWLLAGGWNPGRRLLFWCC